MLIQNLLKFCFAVVGGLVPRRCQSSTSTVCSINIKYRRRRRRKQKFPKFRRASPSFPGLLAALLLLFI